MRDGGPVDDEKSVRTARFRANPTRFHTLREAVPGLDEGDVLPVERLLDDAKILQMRFCRTRCYVFPLKHDDALVNDGLPKDLENGLDKLPVAPSRAKRRIGLRQDDGERRPP